MARRLLLVTVLVIALLGVVACSGGESSTDSGDPAGGAITPDNMPTLDGAKLLQERCTACHTLDRVNAADKTFGEWVSTIDRMIGNGAQLTPEEQTVLADYLTK